MAQPTNILHDPEVKESGLEQDHVDAIQTVTDAIGHHTAEYDALVKKYGKQPPKPGDLESRVMQCLTLLSTNPAFGKEFEETMEKIHPLPANHPLAKHLNK
jgi:hypothetical protein